MIVCVGLLFGWWNCGLKGLFELFGGFVLVWREW